MTVDYPPPQVTLDEHEAHIADLQRRLRELEDLLNYLGISSRAASPVSFRYDAATDTIVTPTGETTITQTTILDSTHTAAADPHTGYLLESLFDAKGDIIAASAADTPAKVTVGANDTLLVADSAQTAGVKWATAASLGVGGMLKTASGGYFLIPAGPAAHTGVTPSGTGHTYGSWTEMIASTAAAIYIVGAIITVAPESGKNYVQLDIGTGAAASETSVGEWKYSTQTFTDGALAQETVPTVSTIFPFPIPVATATRIAARMAVDTTGGLAHGLTLVAINQADLVAI